MINNHFIFTYFSVDNLIFNLWKQLAGLFYHLMSNTVLYLKTGIEFSLKDLQAKKLGQIYNIVFPNYWMHISYILQFCDTNRRDQQSSLTTKQSPTSSQESPLFLTGLCFHCLNQSQLDRVIICMVVFPQIFI